MLDENTDGSPVPNTGTDNDLKYRSHRALTWSYLPLPNGKICKVGQTVAQWWRSCWWKKPGVQAACTDRSRVPDTRRFPVRSRGSRTFVQIEAGGFYPRFYGRQIGVGDSKYVIVFDPLLTGHVIRRMRSGRVRIFNGNQWETL